MNIDEIKSLLEMMENSSVTLLEVKEGESKIRLEKNTAQMQVSSVQAMPLQTLPLSSNALPIQPPLDDAIEGEANVDFNKTFEVKSPMVGVFYAAPAPEADPFVRLGSWVKQGDVICIIEAMKILNEIIAEKDGEIVDICVENGQVVEFSQTLFKIC